MSNATYVVSVCERMDDGRWITCGTGWLDGVAGSYTIMDCPADLGDDVYDALDAEINDTDGDITMVYHDVTMDDGREFRAEIERAA